MWVLGVSVEILDSRHLICDLSITDSYIMNILIIFYLFPIIYIFIYNIYQCLKL